MKYVSVYLDDEIVYLTCDPVITKLCEDYGYSATDNGDYNGNTQELTHLNTYKCLFHYTVLSDEMFRRDRTSIHTSDTNEIRVTTDGGLFILLHYRQSETAYIKRLNRLKEMLTEYHNMGMHMTSFMPIVAESAKLIFKISMYILTMN